MAECKVIIECCSGQTGCNEKVTIGYLKSFIKNTLDEDLILTSGGSPVYVTTTQPDSYEPTYAELTGGTLLPIFYDAGTNNGASNIDGITINGTYNNNETVDQTDLVLTYTRFKGLTISAGKTTFSQCGDSTSLSYDYILTKSVKGISVCDPLTYSTTQSDIKDTSNTAPNNVTFSSSQGWLTISTTTASAGKNGYMQAESRSSVVTASLVYKGSTKSASNSITITQNALTGSYSTYDDRYYTSVEITSHSETAQTSCAELTVNASATGYYYDRYYWTDNCNYTYWDEGEYEDRSGSEDAGSDSYTFSEVLCPTESQTDTHTIEITYHNYSDSVEFVRTCSQTCNCPSWTDYGSCTYNNQSDESLWAAVCGGDFQVCCSIPITTHTGTWVEGVCTDVTGTTAETQCATIVIPGNTLQTATSYTGSVTTEEGGVINYTVWQKAGPCGGCTGDVTTNSWENKSVNVGACDESVTVTLNGTATTRYDNCSATTASVTTSITYTFATNETSDPITITKTFEGATITINQAAGPCHGCTGETTSYTWNNTTGTAGMCDTAATVTIYGVRTLSYGNCPDVTASTSTTQTYTFSKNNTSNAVTHTFYYPDSTSAGHATITITQDAGPCACTGETTSITWTDTATTAGACDTSVLVNISGSKIYHYGNCPDSSVTTSTTATYTFSKNNTSNAVTHTFYYPDSTTQGHATITVTQAAGPCECLDETTTYEYGDVSAHVNPCQTSSSFDIPYTATTTYSNCPSRQVIGTVPVTVTYDVCNEGSGYITRTFYYPSDKPAGYGTITLVQDCPCDCLNPSTTYCYGRVETTAEKCDTSKTVNVPYSAITSYSNCPDSVSTGTSAVTVTFTKNQTTTEQTHSLTLPCGGGVTVVQAAGPCDCTPSTSYTYANVTSGAGKCDTSKIVNIPYTATTLNADCTTSTSYGSASTTVTFTKNNTSSATAHTFYYPDSTTPGHSTITINQAAGPCECTPATSYTYANVTSGAGKCDTSKTVSIPYTATTTGSNCTTAETTGSATTTVSFTANETAVATAHTFYYPDSTTPGHSTITINQEAGPCTITCTCTNAISVSPSSLEFAYDDYSGASRPKSVSATVASCGEITAARFTGTGDSYFYTESAATTNGIEWKFIPLSSNTSGSDIIGTFRIQYKANGVACTAKDVPIIHHHSTDPCLNAVCTSLTVTGVTATITSDEHISYTVGTYNANSCVSNISASSSENWLSVSANTSLNRVVGTMSAQDCETNARTSTVTLSWTVNGNNCSSSWTVTQAGNSDACPCQTYEYSAGTSSMPDSHVLIDKCGGSNSINLYMKRRCTETTPYGSWEDCDVYYDLINLTPSGYRNFTATTGSSYITFEKSTPNTGSSPLSDGYRIRFYSDAGKTNLVLETDTFGTWQPTGGTNCGCDGKQCNELTLSNIKTTNFSSSAHNGEKIADISKSNCVSNLSVSVTSGGTWLSAGLGSTSGAVYAYMDAQGCETSARSGTVQVSYVVDGHNCSSAITVGQNGDSTPCATCDDCIIGSFTPTFDWNESGSSVSETVWHIATTSVNNVSVSCDTSKFNYTKQYYYGGYVQVDFYPVGANLSTYNTISDTVSITASCGSQTCYDSVTLIQGVSPDCTCDSTSITAKTFDSTEYGISYSATVISADVCCTIENVVCSNYNDFTTGFTDSSSIYVYPNNANVTTTPITATISITASCGNDTCYTSVTVTQLGTDEPSCTCNDYIASANTTTFPQTGGTITAYTIVHSCGTVEAISANCSNLITNVYTSSTADGTNIVATASANSGENDVTCTIGYKFWPTPTSSCTSGGTTVTVPGTGACDCEKSNFKFTESNSKTLSKNVGSGTSNVSAAFTVDCSCTIVSSNTSGNTSLLSSVTIDNTNKTITVSYTENPGSSTRTAGIKFTISGKDCGEIWLSLTQASGTAPCQCNSFAITSAPYSATCISKASHTSEKIAEYSGLCGTLTGLTSSETWLKNLNSGTTGEIKADFEANCGTERTATVTVKYNNGGTCSDKTFEVKQCAGGYTGISASPSSLDCNGGDVTFTPNART